MKGINFILQKAQGRSAYKAYLALLCDHILLKMGTPCSGVAYLSHGLYLQAVRSQDRGPRQISLTSRTSESVIIGRGKVKLNLSHIFTFTKLIIKVISICSWSQQGFKHALD